MKKQMIKLKKLKNKLENTNKKKKSLNLRQRNRI